MSGNISLAANAYTSTAYTDMRKPIYGPCAIILNYLKCEADSRSVYIFCGRHCDYIKVLLRKSNGYILRYKRLIT